MNTFFDRYMQTQDRSKTILTTFTGSYNAAELTQQMDAYVDLLHNKKIRGKRVAVLVPHVFSYVSLIMAINKLGGVVSPISSSYRSDDLKQILSFLDPHIVFTITTHGGFPFAHEVEEWAKSSDNYTVLYKSDDSFQWEERNIGDMSREKPDEAAPIDFISFTSGSTGVPKGLMLQTSNLEALGQCFKDTSDMRAGDRLFVTAPASSVMGLAIISVGFKQGAQIILPDSFELPLMVKLMKDSNINKMLTTPSILKAIYPFAEQMAPVTIANLEFCGLAGEVVTEEISNQFSFNDKCRISGIYGCSEHGGILDCDLRKKAQWSLYSGIDYKIDLDGELLVRTPHGFLGYYKREDLTSQVWTLDGWFRTGDLVRMNEDNKFEIIGRKKDLIKKGGQQVAPGEVEHILLQHPNVKQAVVLGAPHPVYGEQVVAFTVLHDATSVKELYPFCSGRIAGYKVPDAIEVLSEIPIVQGKADKITLRKMFLAKKG
ncbi:MULTISPECIES: class I adenylate-forming enzyme family protein [unclassified Paenibacillus]|uniref:class I adenylate-forming enzyme family protein n=1 Tax=unclassified Paenibacillus TaxID=185978 RepID=UPI001AEA28FA|nr:MULTISPECIES: class I adenylate-forming enzyme family protein [unclassified Paenibacillus]MBP1153979.1 acyl-CoA synthetase (AMP-forming)/AMP-acid ligase II [Paenibacillus sp. PvP091]MBP1170636.1 acyl-CoA synthetase (AMP-forming)/AMP-acid ligase II [Paenibacillus sp. PvR098]MBP2441664.1 acyl-CoA synthetase (AMP-forming)/AMP-acid ligase II [Paenibacillus sp. PvP052]